MMVSIGKIGYQRRIKLSIRKIKIDPSKRYQTSNYIDMYVCPVCEEEDCQMCDDEYQCQESNFEGFGNGTPLLSKEIYGR